MRRFAAPSALWSHPSVVNVMALRPLTSTATHDVGGSGVDDAVSALRRKLRSLVLHDGSASSRQQAEALANALSSSSSSSRSSSNNILIKRAPFPSEGSLLRLLPVWALAMLSSVSGQVVSGANTAATELVAELADTNDVGTVDVVIGCGRRTAAACIGLKRALPNCVFNIQVLDPRCGRVLTPLLFNKVVTPQHDRPQFSNAILTVGALSWASDERALIAECEAYAETIAAKEDLFHGLMDGSKGPRLVVLCGGDTARKSIDVQLVEQEIVRAVNMAHVPHERVFVVGSRRTPALLLAKLQVLGMQVWTPPPEWVSREPPESTNISASTNSSIGNIYNPYRACIALGDAFVVTGDSVSMISDACSTGKPVFVVRRGCDGNLLGSKLERFHNGLLERGCVSSHLSPLSAAADGDGNRCHKLTDAQDVAIIIAQELNHPTLNLLEGKLR